MAGKRSAVMLIILGCCCLIAAAALFAYNRLTSDRAATASDELTETLTALIEASASAAPEDDGTDPLLVGQGLTEEPLVTISVDDYEVAGIITMPAIDIELAVISEWSYPNLRISACRYSGAPSGQLVLLAHNYKQHFGRISELEPGDVVTFTEPDGALYNYEVTDTEIKGKYELKDILSGTWDLTLFTCTYGGANRVVVRCRLTG